MTATVPFDHVLFFNGDGKNVLDHRFNEADARQCISIAYLSLGVYSAVIMKGERRIGTVKVMKE